MDASGSSSLAKQEVSLAELIQLCAVDSLLYAHTFFPSTFRQHSPEFHRRVWSKLDGPSRLVNAQIFRGGAKTTILRTYSSKRIAYGLAHTMLYIGKSEGHAARSVRWLRRQIMYNNFWASTFQLRAGGKWTDTECEIIHGVDEYPIWIMAMGITGSVRGINQDDFRPDLIVVDDVIDEENSSTLEQREKTNNLIHGALKESLSPASEAPDAKMAMAQTPLNKEDASVQALSDDEWDSIVCGCWTPETMDLPIHLQESIWPERWSSQTLREEKRAAAKRNKLSLWTREKECRITSPETSAFRAEWLQYYDLAPERRQMDVVIFIDPVPPPSPAQIAKGFKGKDFEAFAVAGRWKGNYYLLDYSYNRGHEPDWTVSEFFRLCAKWKPREVGVESVAYQRTLAWLLRGAMKDRRQYYVVREVTDNRSKYDKIVDGLNALASNGVLYILPTMVEAQQQFTDYPDVSHDDLIESWAMAMTMLQNASFLDDEDEFGDEMDSEAGIPALTYASRAP